MDVKQQMEDSFETTFESNEVEHKVGNSATDPRVEWMLKMLRTHFKARVKANVLKTFSISESCLGQVEEFFESHDVRVLYFAQLSSTKMDVFTFAPKEMKGVVLYFMKLHTGSVPTDDFLREIIVGDMNGDPLLHLKQITQDIYMPLISNPANREANVQITVGQTQGITCLPLPPEVPESGAGKDRIHVLEGCLITWTKQIKAVLRQDPEDLLRSDGHPIPLVETEFWRNKSVNLNSIFEQLQSSSVHPHPHPSWAAIVGRLWKFNAPELCWFLLSMITAVITGAVLPIFALLVEMALSVFFEMNNEALRVDISFWADYRNADGIGHSLWPLCFPPTVCH